MAEEPWDLEIGQRLGRWTVEATLGQGGMGRVYKIRHQPLESFRALKVLTTRRSGLDSRLLKEGYAQANLDHPNVVAVFDLIEDGELVGLLMEWVDGPRLDRWLEQEARSHAEIEQVFRGVVAGVAAAHDRGFVHRDLKPQNVLLVRDGADWRPKVADFGLVKLLEAAGPAADASRTEDWQAMGTLAYAAPEQLEDAAGVDRRADIYALGCLLYHLCCGAPPFAGSPARIISAQLSGAWLPPRDLAPELPQHLVDAIEAAMQRDPQRRPASCRALLEILDRGGPGSFDTLADEDPRPETPPKPPPETPEETPPETPARSPRRAAALLAAVGAAALIAGALIALPERAGPPAEDRAASGAPDQELAFFDSAGFDGQLEQALALAPARVRVAVIDPFSANAVPARLDAWLTAVHRQGGDISHVEVPGPVPKGPLDFALEVAVAALGQAAEPRPTDSVRGYDAVLSCDPVGEVVEVTFRRR